MGLYSEHWAAVITSMRERSHHPRKEPRAHYRSPQFRHLPPAPGNHLLPVSVGFPLLDIS